MQRSPCIGYVLSMSRSTFSHLTAKMIVLPARSARTSLGRSCKPIKLWTGSSIMLKRARNFAFLSQVPRSALQGLQEHSQITFQATGCL